MQWADVITHSRSTRWLRPLAVAAVALLFASPAAEAAVLIGSVDTNPGTANVNLTTQGDLDWAIWNLNGTAVVPGTPTNRKNLVSPATPFIGPTLSTVGGGSLRGPSSGQTGTKLFSYTDGISPTSLASSTQGVIFNNQVNTVGAGLQVNITGVVGQETTVYVWATGFGVTGTMTASLAGAADVVLSTQAFGSVRAPTLFTFTFTPTLATDQLNLSYVTTTSTSGSGHVGIQAIAVSAVPEPSKAVLCFLGLMGLLRRRRR